MPSLLAFKETALPAELQPNALYFVAPPAHPGYVEIYVTNAAGSAARRVIDQATIQGMMDASGDPTVTSGAAIYVCQDRSGPTAP